MWWYYKCVNLVRVLIQGSKVILCVTWKCLARAAVQAGLCPVPTLWLDQPPLGMSKKKTDCLKRRASDALSLLFWRSDSLEHGLNISETPRSCALQRAPVRWTLTLETNHLWSLGPCQCRNTTEQRLQRRAFPVTSRSRGLPEGARTDHVTPKQRTELTRENETKKQQPASTTDSKYNKQSVFILTKLVKFDLNAVTEQRHLSWSFSWLVKLWNRKNGILSYS